MTDVVADTSGLVSLGIGNDHPTEPLDLFLQRYDVAIPEQVADELAATAEYDDAAGVGAEAVLASREALQVHADVTPDSSVSLDVGERAAIGLGNELGARFLYYDEFTNLAKFQMAARQPETVTTPKVLQALVLDGELTREEGGAVLDAVIAGRGWDQEPFPNQARTWFEADG